MTTKVYGEAVYGAIANGMAVSNALSNLATVLAKHGHSSLRAQILRDLLARFEKDEEKLTLTVRVARAQDIEKFAKEIALFTDEHHLRETVIKVDETLIGGYTLESTEHRLDASHKKLLATIYQNVIND